MQFEYFKTLHKPINDANSLDHSGRMLTLACYGNKVPGMEPLLANEQMKKCIFQSFPPKQQQQYIGSNSQQVATMPLSDIIEFMSKQKEFC